MSLLMDALRKAELAKRQGHGEAGEEQAPPADGGLSLEPLHIEPATPAVADKPAASEATTVQGTAADLPHLPAHLEELDAQFLAEAKQAASTRLKPASAPIPRPPPAAEAGARAAPDPAGNRGAAVPERRPPATGQQQSAARNLFAAKAPEVAAGSRKPFAIAVGSLTLFAACGIGGYFWWQLQPRTPPLALRSPPAVRPAVPAGAAVAPAPTPGTAASPTAAAVTPSLPTASRPAAAVADDEDEAPVAARPASRLPARPASPPAVPEGDGPIRLSKTPLRVNPALARGFEAFGRGDVATAQVEYEKAFRADPRNTDALHGLAAIAVRQGRLDQAEALYRQIAEADPHDAIALSAVINLRGQVDPGAAESRLKTLAAERPELAAPQFALGNLYARNGRWHDAQQAYFRAYTAEPDNPDIIYNLAISLEHLRQPKLAARYYAESLAAAQGRTAGFDKEQAAARLRSLQP